MFWLRNQKNNYQLPTLIFGPVYVFFQAYIVSEAYSKRDNWATALCNNVIIRGDLKYLQEFRSHLRLTPSLVQDAIER